MQLNLHTLTFAVCVGTLLSSCSHSSLTNDTNHAHDTSEWPARAQTVYSNHHQLFFENDYAVVERETGFALHVSNLNDGSPRNEGAITINLDFGDQHINTELASPARPGIYLVDLTFAEAGSYSWSVVIDGAITTLANVEVYADEHSALHAAEDVAEDEHGITMLKEQQWPIRLRVEQVAVSSVAHQIPATARVTACKTHTAKVVAATSGNLHAPLNSARVVLGQHVAAGDLLAIIRVPLLGNNRAAWQAAQAQATSEVERSAAALIQATSSYQRVKDLHAQQAKSPRELEEAHYQYQSALAADKAAASTLAAYSQSPTGTSFDLEILAPIGGQVIAAPTARGEWTTSGDELFQLQDLSQLHVSVRVPENDLAQLAANLSAYVMHPNNGEVIELPGTDGELLLAAQKVDPQTHAAEMLYEIPNPGWLRSGMTLMAQLSTGEAHVVMAVPIGAIVDDSGINVAFVQTAGETFERRAVRLGHRDGARVEILEGLALGERVVIDGAYVVHLTALSGSIPEHSH